MATNSDLEFWPEAVDPDQTSWTVHEGLPMLACVDLKNKIAVVPEARTMATEQIRFHEIFHAAESEIHEHESGRGDVVCKMLEEFRVDAIARERGIYLYQRHDDFDWLQILQEVQNTAFAQAMLYLQTRFQAEGDCADDVKSAWATMRHRLDSRTVEILEEAIADIASDLSIRMRERWAHKLTRYFTPPPAPPPQPPIKQEVKDELERQDQEMRDQQEQEQEDQRRQEERERADKNSKRGAAPSIGTLPLFGLAEIHDHCGRQQHPKQVKAPAQPASRGVVPVYMDRYCLDKRIYQTEHRGGTLIIDMSGSMSWNWKFLKQEIERLPNLSVLGYAGVHGAGRRDKKGILGRICVLARAGRFDPLIALPERQHNGQNYVDVEALQYGGQKFKGPHIWLSDGYAVGGKYDGSGETDAWWCKDGPLQTKVREVMRQYKIVRIGNLEDALHWLHRTKPIEVSLSGTWHYPQPGTNMRPPRRRP